MKLSVVHTLYSGLGGHGSVFFSLIKADRTKSIDQKAVFCGIEAVNPDYLKLCKQWTVPFRFVKKKPGADFAVYIKLYRAYRTLKPDVIVLHGSAFIFVAWLYRFFNRRTLIFVRETQAHHLKTNREWFWLKWSLRLSQKLIFLTTESLNGVVQKFPGLSVAQKAVIIPNGIDMDLYKPTVYVGSDKGLTLGMQSRLQRIKDHPTLLRAFRIVMNQFPDLELKLRIAGDGVTMVELKELAVKLNIAERVELLGMLPEQELAAFMNELDIYIHATFGETMSNSIMQAMACGLPIVASDVWGVNNMLEHHQTALLVPVQDPEAMASALVQLITNKNLRADLGTMARKEAVEKYSNDRLFKEYSTLYITSQRKG
jgi:glycosyltransferase involved in cell wall biosynthesis